MVNFVPNPTETEKVMDLFRKTTAEPNGTKIQFIEFIENSKARY